MWGTYRLVGLAGLAQSCRSTVDFFNHACQILAHFIQTLRQLLGQFVPVDQSKSAFILFVVIKGGNLRSFTLLIRTL